MLNKKLGIKVENVHAQYRDGILGKVVKRIKVSFLLPDESIDFVIGHVLATQAEMLDSVSMMKNASSFSLQRGKDTTNDKSKCCFLGDG